MGDIQPDWPIALLQARGVAGQFDIYPKSIHVPAQRDQVRPQHACCRLHAPGDELGLLVLVPAANRTLASKPHMRFVDNSVAHETQSNGVYLQPCAGEGLCDVARSASMYAAVHAGQRPHLGILLPVAY